MIVRMAYTATLKTMVKQLFLDVLDLMQALLITARKKKKLLLRFQNLGPTPNPTILHYLCFPRILPILPTFRSKLARVIAIVTMIVQKDSFAIKD